MQFHRRTQGEVIPDYRFVVSGDHLVNPSPTQQVAGTASTIAVLARDREGTAPGDAGIIPFPWNACQRLIRRAFVPDELPIMIEMIFSNKDRGDGTPSQIIHSLSGVEAQNFVDVINGALETLDLPSKIRKRCVKALYKICGRHAILPESLQIPLCYDRQGYPVYQGGFGDVWRGRYCDKDVAVKVIRVRSRPDLRKVVPSFCKEVVTWKSLQHPNVLPLIGVTMNEYQFAMVSEWMENGSINEFLSVNPDADRLKLLVDVTNGLIYMHGEGMIHGDLKGANILIDQDGRARLADFGLLTIMSDSSNQLFSSTEMQGGSQRWMSPELFDPQQFGLENTRPTVQSDSYALGMVVYEVISGRLPFYEYLSSTVSTMILKGQRPVRDADFPDVIWDMLQWCWAAQYSDRPSIKQILQCLEDAIELLRPPSVDEETATTDADNLDYVNPSLGIPSPIAGGFYCSGSWSYENLCVSCSSCGQVGHASGSFTARVPYPWFNNFNVAPWQNFPKDAASLYPSTPRGPVGFDHAIRCPQTRPREEWQDALVFDYWRMGVRG